MNTTATADEMTGAASNGARRFGRYAKRSAERIKRNASPEVATLIADVEDLLQKVGHIADAEVAQVRERIQEKIAVAKDTLTNRRVQITKAARYAAGATDDFVHENPWRSTGLAALAGLVVGLVLFRR
jgi:ElaB/YqjD/DUF883 family membrane-anchored ribosome-binding protein